MSQGYRLNCMIVDDEPVARKGLEEYVRGVDFLSCVGTCEDAVKAVSMINNNKIDLMYLDVEMPKMSGIELIRMLKNPPLCILTTAYPHYALDGFALDVIDYLVKPITFERFMKATRKAYEYFSFKAQALPSSGVEDYFFVKCDSKYEKVFYKDVLYVEAMQNYAVIHTPGRKMITYITLSGLEQQLPKELFIKVHKSYIVSIAHVKAIEGAEIIIESAEADRIPISRAHKEEIVQQILGNRLFRR